MPFSAFRFTILAKFLEFIIICWGLYMGKRFTVGFQTVNLHSKYSFALWNAIAREAEARDVNLILFPGESPNTPYGFAYQSNTIYDFIRPDNMDALIMATGTLRAGWPSV